MRESLPIELRIFAFVLTVALWYFLAKPLLIAIFALLQMFAHVHLTRSGAGTAYLLTVAIGTFFIWRSMFGGAAKSL